MLGRTGQRRQIESDVNRRTSRKEKSKWVEVIYSRAFEVWADEKKKKAAAIESAHCETRL